MLTIGHRKDSDITVLDLAGDFGADAQAAISELVAKYTHDAHTNIVWNFRDVSAINSSGIGILLNACGEIKKHGAIAKLARVSPAALEVFGIHKVIPVFDIYPDEAAAKKRIRIEVEETDKAYVRLFERINVDLKARFKEFKKGFLRGLARPRAADATSLSMCGIFLKTGSTYPKDTLLETTLLLPEGGSKPQVKFLGKVVWVADREKQPGLYPGMALCTLFMEDAEKAKLEGFIKAHGG
jgi:anti-anti-sigma factor